MEFEIFKIVMGLRNYYKVHYSMTNECIWVECSSLKSKTEHETEIMWKNSDTKLSLREFKMKHNELVFKSFAIKTEFERIKKELENFYKKTIAKN